MEWDRFDIVEAHYWYCIDYHSGQGSPLYARLCRIGRYFAPSRMSMGYETLTDNGKEIYSMLVVREIDNR